LLINLEPPTINDYISSSDQIEIATRSRSKKKKLVGSLLFTTDPVLPLKRSMRSLEEWGLEG